MRVGDDAGWTAVWHSRIGLRLAASFGALLLLVVVALILCAHAFQSIGRAEREVQAFERARHAADRASLLMREQYIHQAHTLIVFDDTHLDHYRDVVAVASQAIDELRAALATPEDAALVDELEAHRAANHKTFEELTVPAVLRGDRAEAVRLHEDMEKSVVAFSRTVRQLHDRNDARATEARVEMERAWSRAQMAALACLAAALVLGAVMAYLLTRTVVARVAVLRAGAERIGAGDLEHRIRLDARDELGELARAFDTMAEALARREEELVRAQRLASMGQVAAGIAHELNNPLGVILGYVKLLRRRGEWDDDALGVIEQEATLASETVAAMLDLARPLSLKLAEVDLGAILRESVERLSQVERVQGVDVKVVSTAPVIAWADEARLRQVVANLLTNAAEAAAPSGHVEASVHTTGDEVELTVDDDGAGFPEADRRKVTEPFFTTKSHGAGLGLSIVRTLVDAHQGDLGFERSPLGGARVWVRLPAHAASRERLE
ncbi:MAG: HAMP domain-containing histidine kinase [Polyangiaceae bacterium]|nr:HAMP domain-containing histidine kinase [Polyangiaceae bacterium]